MAPKNKEIRPFEQDNPEGIINSDITSEMQSAYLDYAMSVIVSRALPDVRDGLKPVHRRIIYAMQEHNMIHTGKFHKSATVVGNVMSKYHPHGDVAIYDSLVRMAQDFTLRYPLVIPQGNFGSIDGDPAAAMRYTECKLAQVSEKLYADIDKDTVDVELNDLQNEEPRFLPSVLPNLLLNGSSGIAVGMATNIPPHNLGEVVDGLIHTMDNAETLGNEKDIYEVELNLNFNKNREKKIGDTVKVVKTEFSSSASVEDLINHIKGPDFPTGGIIYDQKEIIQMYATGKGRVVTRAKMEIEESKTGKTKIIVTEIPYQVNKATLIGKIADLAREKKIDGIYDLRDESNREGMRIMIELKKEAIAKKVQNQLYKYTQLQNTFNANMVALLDNEPLLMPLKMMLEEFIKHRQKIVVRRTIFDLRKYKEREHILAGLKKALDHLDEIIKLIRNSKDAETAKIGLIEKFDFTEIQAQAILDMQLRKLAALERKKIEDELEEITKTIKGLEALLISPKKIAETIKAELLALKEQYGDERKTKVIKGKVGELSDEDLIVDEACILTISDNGYIKRLKEDTYKKQGRGGKGVTGQTLKEEDEVSMLRTCRTHDYALFFTNLGKAYKLRVWEIAESSRTAKGTALVNYLNIQKEEKVESLLTLTPEEFESSKGYVFFGTQKGNVKKTSLEEFANIRASGIIAIKLDANDSLVWAQVSSGSDTVLLTTAQGQSIRFTEKDVRPMGRAAAGVIGVKLAKRDDRVVGMVVIPQKSGNLDLITVTELGYGKKTKLAEYKVQGRGGSGIQTHKVNDKTGELINAKTQDETSTGDILIATLTGKVIRITNSSIPQQGRATSGVRLIRLDETDKVTSMALIEEIESVVDAE